MNCIGPTAWSQSGSPCQAVVFGVARIAANGSPSRAGPRIGVEECPSSPRVRSPTVPCCDSIQPMPANVVHPTSQPFGASSWALA